MRLDKYLAHAGYGTRREVKKLIRQKHVYVNDVLCCQDDQKIDENKDRIRVDDTVVSLQLQIYIMLHKPSGVITAVQDPFHDTVMDLINEQLPPGCFPVGRLDLDTEGLLLITNDGALAHKLLSPKKHVDKVYYVESRNPLEDGDIKRLCEGIEIDGGESCLPADVRRIAENRFLLTIREGKYHQVKRMMIALNNEVIYLKRVQMGSLRLDDSLKKGEYRYLYEEEIERLKNRKETT